MVNKEISKEIIWLLMGIIISYTIAIIILPSQNTIVSDLYIGALPDTESLLNTISSPVVFLISFFLFFPILFIINTIRGMIQKFSNRAFNTYLMFISFISILASGLLLLLHEPIAIVLTGNLNFYNPLDGLIESPSIHSTLNIYMYSILVFMFFQILILFMTAKKVFNMLR